MYPIAFRKPPPALPACRSSNRCVPGFDFKEFIVRLKGEAPDYYSLQYRYRSEFDQSQDLQVLCPAVSPTDNQNFPVLAAFVVEAVRMWEVFAAFHIHLACFLPKLLRLPVLERKRPVFP